MDHKIVRNGLVNAVIAEMMGPGSEDPFTPNESHVEYELISENPLQRYTVGILYEQGITHNDSDDATTDIEIGSYGPMGDPHDPNDATAEIEIDSDVPMGDLLLDSLLDVATTTANQYYPSSIGMSFYTSGINPELRVQIRWGEYKKTESLECFVFLRELPEAAVDDPVFVRYLKYVNGKLCLLDDLTPDIRDRLLEIAPDSGEWKRAVYLLFNLQLHGWKRTPKYKHADIAFVPSEETTRQREIIDYGLEMICVRRPNLVDNCTLFTLALVNTHKRDVKKNAELTFFQVGFSVSPVDSKVCFLDYEVPVNKSGDDLEDASMALLYRKRKVYAVGHGCAVSWNKEGTLLETQIIPSYEVPSAVFDVEELRSLSHILDMINLSDISNMSRGNMLEELAEFVKVYRGWIDCERDRANLLESHYRKTALRHLETCTAAADRMARGVTLLNEDVIFQAFQLANRAMLMQRYHTELQDQKRYPEDTAVRWPDYHAGVGASWRPFQLAFLLLNLEGITNPTGPDRDLVDLIWFPTGGGKTEAYLGLTAFCIFYRRLRRHVRGGGTAILMRYTLRMLTTQQFQRASTLICACEIIRREMSCELGDEAISLGLWLGRDNTPTLVSEAQLALDDLAMGIKPTNKFLVLSCPWCGTRITKDRETDMGCWGYRISPNPKRLVIHCTNDTCPFHEELPIRVVDEDIYKMPPTLLFATVDKFAQMPWKAEVSRIFGLSSGFDTPELIIQDELHLISGPLGTIVGLYEVAVDELCAAKGIRPKIVASTATIRRASEQVRALYARDVSIFPPPGIDAEDSFFSREAKLTHKPGRLYLGIMATGRTLTSTQVRLVAAIMQSIAELQYNDVHKDPYWTLVSYFNTIRELGRCSTLAQDDIKDQIRRMAQRHNTDKRTYLRPYELTGSRKSADIPTMLERLECSYPNPNVINLLHTSNMMSVGIDIDRLGIMEMVSQPKANAEYIQATSRVGRRYPGLIITLLDGARSRDRSHYEHFVGYHQALYRYVEPTSVTPFSGPARDRALRAVLVSLVRHRLGLLLNGDAARFSNNIDGLDDVVNRIVDRARYIMRDEADATAADLVEYIKEWKEITAMHTSLLYSSKRDGHLLYQAGRKGKYWPTMQSMRNVDSPGNLLIID